MSSICIALYLVFLFLVFIIFNLLSPCIYSTPCFYFIYYLNLHLLPILLPSFASQKKDIAGFLFILSSTKNKMRQAIQKMPAEFSPLPQHESLTPNLFSTTTFSIGLANSRYNVNTDQYNVNTDAYNVSSGQHNASTGLYNVSSGQYNQSTDTYNVSSGRYNASIGEYNVSSDQYNASTAIMVSTIRTINSISLFYPIAQSSDLLNAPHNLLPT